MNTDMSNKFSAQCGGQFIKPFTKGVKFRK